MADLEKDSIVQVMRKVTSRAMTDRLSVGEKLFQAMNSTDFMMMLILAKHSKESTKRIYMKDLAEQTQMPMRRVSNIIQTLAAQDWVSWDFDGNGDEGTYVELTETGLDATEQQNEKIETFYQKIIDRFGQERFIHMMKDVSDLEDIMNKTLNEWEDVE